MAAVKIGLLCMSAALAVPVYKALPEKVRGIFPVELFQCGDIVTLHPWKRCERGTRFDVHSMTWVHYSTLKLIDCAVGLPPQPLPRAEDLVDRP